MLCYHDVEAPECYDHCTAKWPGRQACEALVGGPKATRSNKAPLATSEKPSQKTFSLSRTTSMKQKYLGLHTSNEREGVGELDGGETRQHKRHETRWSGESWLSGTSGGSGESEDEGGDEIRCTRGGTRRGRTKEADRGHPDYFFLVAFSCGRGGRQELGKVLGEDETYGSLGDLATFAISLLDRLDDTDWRKGWVSARSTATTKENKSVPATVCRMSRTAKRPRGGYSAKDSTLRQSTLAIWHEGKRSARRLTTWAWRGPS